MSVPFKYHDMGQRIINLLSLKVKKNGRVDTDGGDKTPVGLGLTVEALVQDTRIGACKTCIIGLLDSNEVKGYSFYFSNEKDEFINKPNVLNRVNFNFCPTCGREIE